MDNTALNTTEDAIEMTLLDSSNGKPVVNGSLVVAPARENYHSIPDGGESGHYDKHYKPPVDVNVLKRKMSIAKGFMDISLITANANQLKNLLKYGDSSAALFYITLTLLLSSIILQISTGLMLIIKEKFDLNLEDEQESAELYNNITVILVFLTLLINVFVGALGVDVMKHYAPPQGPIYQGDKNYDPNHGSSGILFPGPNSLNKLLSNSSSA